MSWQESGEVALELEGHGCRPTSSSRRRTNQPTAAHAKRLDILSKLSRSSSSRAGSIAVLTAALTERARRRRCSH